MAENIGEKSGLSQEQQMSRGKFETLKNGIRNSLMMGNRLYKEGNLTRESLGEALKGVEKIFINLKKQYPNDPELREIEAYYVDLSGDFEKGDKVELDSSYDKIVSDMRMELENSKIKKENPENSGLKDVVDKLKTAGIKPTYVLTSGDKKAKTIVYFMGIHPHPKATPEDQAAIAKSQKHIFDAIEGGVSGEITHTFFGEGVPSGKEIDVRNIQFDQLPENHPAKAMGQMAEYQASKKMGSKLHVVGMENLDMFNDVQSGGRVSDYRISINNVVIADNVVDNLNQSGEQIAFMSLGASHELKETTPLPISQVLAYKGVNVVVVDAATPYYKL
ncbi:MAG: hypothetical protein WC873_04365 [Candidatus Gracilibacteria bacterium]